MKSQILEKIKNNFKLTEEEFVLIEQVLTDDMNLPRLSFCIDTMINYHIQGEVLVAYVVFQFYKIASPQAEELKGKLSIPQQKLYETFKILRSVRELTKNGEAEDIRRMFVAICQDMRVVIIKFATILFDLRQISLPMSDGDLSFVNMVSDIFAPLAERLGLSQFKNDFEDECFMRLEPAAYEELKNNVLMKTEDNQKQLAITTAKLQAILAFKGKFSPVKNTFTASIKRL